MDAAQNSPTQPTQTPSTTPPPVQQQPSMPSVQKQPESTNKGLLVAIAIVAVIVVSVGVYAFISKQSTISSQSMNSLTTQVSHAPVMSPIPSGAMHEAAQGTSLTTGSTNADLTQDSNTLNKGLDSANSDMMSADQGLNDKPTDLSQ